MCLDIDQCLIVASLASLNSGCSLITAHTEALNCDKISNEDWQENRHKLYLPVLILDPFSFLKFEALLTYVYLVPDGEDESSERPLINWMMKFLFWLYYIKHTIWRFCASLAYSHSTSASRGVRLGCDWYGLTRKMSFDGGWLDMLLIFPQYGPWYSSRIKLINSLRKIIEYSKDNKKSKQLCPRYKVLSLFLLFLFLNFFFSPSFGSTTPNTNRTRWWSITPPALKRSRLTLYFTAAAGLANSWSPPWLLKIKTASQFFLPLCPPLNPEPFLPLP